MLKKKIVLSVVVFVVVILSITRIYYFRESYYLHNLLVLDSSNKVYSTNLLKKSEILLFLMGDNENFFNDFVREFEPKSNFKLIFVAKNSTPKIEKIKEYFYSTKYDSFKEIYKQFNLDVAKSYILRFSEDHFLLEHELLLPQYTTKIINKYSRELKLLKGDTNSITAFMERNIKVKQGEVVLVSQKLSSNCICFRNFELLEEYFSDKGKLKVIVLGDWYDRDINNILRERDNKIKIKRASPELNLLVKNWSESTQRDDFNAVIVNHEGINKSFLLLDKNDFKIWYQLANKQFGFKETIL